MPSAAVACGECGGSWTLRHECGKGTTVNGKPLVADVSPLNAERAKIVQRLRAALGECQDASRSLPPTTGKYASDFPNVETLYSAGWHASACTDRAATFLMQVLDIVDPASKSPAKVK